MKAHLQDIPAKSSSDEVLLNDEAYANPTLTFIDIAIMRFAIFYLRLCRIVDTNS